MVEDVEEIGSQLHIYPLSQLGILHQGEIKVAEHRADKRVAPQVPEMIARVGGIATSFRRVPVAGTRKGAEVKNPARRAGPGKRVSDHIRAFEEFVAAVEILRRNSGCTAARSKAATARSRSILR